MEIPRKFINFRAFLVIFVIIVFSIFGCYLVAVAGAIGWFLLVLAAAALIILCVLANSEKWERHVVLSVFISIAAFIIVILGFFIRLNFWNSIGADGETSFNVSGIINEITINGSGSEITINKLKVDGSRVNGKMKVYIEEAGDKNVLPFVREGNRIVFRAVVISNELISGTKVNSSFLRNNLKYKSYVKYGDANFYSDAAGFLTSLRVKIRENFYAALGSDYGSVAVGMLTGDKSGILSETRSAFSVSGLGHLLAVSGLHIGFMATLLAFIFKKLHMRHSLSAVFTLAFFVLYMFLADFSPSVVRAVIMFTALTFSRLFAVRYDPLSALMFASCVILVIQPFSLFDPSFVLSAGAVYAIILFSAPIAKFLKKIKLPAFLIKPLSVSLSVQAGILPAMMYFFSEIQVYAILANLILMPLISAVFMTIVVALVFSFIAPIMLIPLRITGLGLAALNDAARLIVLLPNAIIPVDPPAIIFLCYPLYFFISGFYMKRMKISIIKSVSICMSAVLLFSGLVYFKSVDSSNYMIPLASYGNVTTVVSVSGQTYVVGDFYKWYDVEDAMLSSGKTRVRTIYVHSLDTVTALALTRFCAKFRVDKILSPYGASIEGLDILFDADINYYYMFEPGEAIGGGFNAVYGSDNKPLAYELNAGAVNVLFCSEKTNYTKIDPEVINRCGIIRTKIYLNEFSERVYFTSVPKGFLGEVPLFQYSTAELGSFIFDLDTGEFLDKKHLFK